ncbi:unnamed protein product [Diabrotica balteata]|uniref:Uncharacterized protein n=1 Tax=Diabrotica balteata TaxID=107213 RepID=A0A9N9TBD3_DIABA|nr:unnamed protein product [Diabrotica balteata]
MELEDKIKYEQIDIYEDQLEKVDIADLFKNDSEENNDLKYVPNDVDYQAILTGSVKNHNLVTEETEKDLFKNDSEENKYFEDTHGNNHVQIKSSNTIYTEQPTDDLKYVTNDADYQAILTGSVKNHNLVTEETEKDKMASVTHKCVYAGCFERNDGRNNKISFFKFPLKDVERTKIWQKNCGNIDISDLKQRVICQHHFAAEHIYQSGQRKLLRKNAVPLKCTQLSTDLGFPPSVVQKGDIDSYIVQHSTGKSLQRQYKSTNSSRKEIVQNDQLIQNMTVHTDEKQIIAQNKKRKTNLSSEKSFTCNVCSMKFTLKSSLRKHLLRHAQENSFECDICHKRFSNNFQCLVHRRTHIKGKSFRCDICFKNFKGELTLNRHMKLHTGANFIKCHYRSKQFSQKESRTEETFLQHIPYNNGSRILTESDQSTQQEFLHDEDKTLQSIMSENSSNISTDNNKLTCSTLLNVEENTVKQTKFDNHLIEQPIQYAFTHGTLKDKPFQCRICYKQFLINTQSKTSFM